MKKVLYLILLLLNLGILFGNGSLERDEYLVGMDDSCRDPELLISSTGDMYFCYIRDDKLQIEKKIYNSSGFVPIVNNFFDNAKQVKSIERFRMPDDTYSLVVHTSLNNVDSLFVLHFIDNELSVVNNTNLGNDSYGSISNYNLYALGYQEFILIYLKNNILNYIYVNDHDVFYNEITDYDTLDYALEGALDNNSFVLKGFLLDQNNKLFSLKIDKLKHESQYITDYGGEPGLSIDYFSNNTEGDSYIIAKNENKLFETKAGNTTVFDLDNSNTSYYFTYENSPKINIYTFNGYELIFNDLVVGNVAKFQFEYNELYYLNSNGDLYLKDLVNNLSDKLLDSSVVDFGFYYNNNNSYIVSAKEVSESLVIDILKRDSKDFVLNDSFKISKNSEDTEPYSFENIMMNVIYRTENIVLDSFVTKYYSYDENNYQIVKQFEVLLTKKESDIQLEVIK